MFAKVIEKVKPSQKEEEQVKEKVADFLKKLNKNLKGAKAQVGGSFAKGTWLAKNHDVDVFALFDQEKDISDKLEKALKKSFKKVERVHGSRDYFQIKEGDINFEIIPVFKIRKAEEAKNVTDVSLLHVEWVKKHLNNDLADQVRLAKQFFRAQKVYGAETFMRGFSGYVVEILIIYYGSFLEFLKHCMHWKAQMVINPEAHGTDLQKFKGSSLIIIDPVQSSRNASAAVSEEQLKKLIKACRSFVQKPVEKSFEEQKPDLKALKKKNVLIEMVPLEGKADVVGTKMVKAFEEIVNQVRKEGFEISEKDWMWSENGYFWMDVKKKVLERKYKHFGPPIKLKEHVESFKKAHKGSKVFEEKGKVYVLKERRYNEIKAFVKSTLKEKAIKEKVKKIRVLN